MNASYKLAITAVLSLAYCGIAHAESNWSLRVGAHLVDPDSDNGDLVRVASSISPTFDISYRLNPNWRLEILAAAPFNHDIELLGGEQVAETDQLPPTVSLQYHISPGRPFSPFFGLGANATIFFSEETSGALAGANLELDDSFGLAASVGADFQFGENLFATGVVRYIDIETDATLDGVDIGSVTIDPIAFGLSLGWRFD